jgi:hypothetical protein
MGLELADRTHFGDARTGPLNRKTMSRKYAFAAKREKKKLSLKREPISSKRST